LSFAFTEQGVAMLSSVLNSERAVQVNIQIMRAFTKLRQMLATHDDLRRKIEEMEQKYDQQFQVVFDAIKLLLEAEEKSRSLKLDLRSRNALRPMAGRGDSRIFQAQRMFPGKVIERGAAFRK
jgi:hypothetical protein